MKPAPRFVGIETSKEYFASDGAGEASAPSVGLEESAWPPLKFHQKGGQVHDQDAGRDGGKV